MRVWMSVVVVLGLVGGAFLWMRGTGPAGAGAPLSGLAADAEALHAAQDHERSQELYARAAEEAEAAGDQRLATAYRAQRGVCLKMLGRLEEARELLTRARERARGWGDRRTEALALGNLAKIAALEGDRATALEHLDTLAAMASAEDDPRLEVWTLEQAASAALDLGDVEGALTRLERAIVRSEGIAPEDDRTDELLREQAWALVLRGDDEGARRSWEKAPPSAAGLANQARQMGLLERPEVGAELAWEAAQLFDQEGADRHPARDQALALHISLLLDAGDFEGAGTRLDALLATEGSEAARTPFRLLAGRRLLLMGDPEAAEAPLRGAHEALQGDPSQEVAAWLLAWCLCDLGRWDEVAAVLDAQPDGLAASVVRSRLVLERPPVVALGLESLPLLEAAAPDDDRSLDVLVDLLGDLVPDPAWLCLELALADADRLRDAGQAPLSRSWLEQGAATALTWQGLLAVRRVTGSWPPPAVREAAAPRLSAWVSGDLPAEEAVVTVLPGPQRSYLVLCTRELGVTTFGLGPASALHEAAVAVAEALRGPTVDGVEAASSNLFEELFGARAQVDLEGKTRWTMILPDILASLPPSMLVTEPPAAGQAPAWLVRRVTARLLPHALVEHRGPMGSGLGQVGAPVPVIEASALAGPDLVSRYGSSALATGPARARSPLDGDPPPLLGDQATAAAVRGAADLAVLELSVPALGGERLGGLVLSADSGATFVDERLGFLPWHRLAELELPSRVVLDRARFSPREARGGPVHAATALMEGGAREVLMTRWPLPGPPRDLVLETLEGVADLDQALAELQRAMVQSAEEAGRPGVAHPRNWAAWLLFCF